MKITTTKQIIPPVPQPDTVTYQLNMTLTPLEASALLEVTRHIGGPSNGPRGLTDRVGASLQEAGVTWGDVKASESMVLHGWGSPG